MFIYIYKENSRIWDSFNNKNWFKEKEKLLELTQQNGITSSSCGVQVGPIKRIFHVKRFLFIHPSLQS